MENIMKNSSPRQIVTEIGTFAEGQEIYCDIHGEFCLGTIDEITDRGTLRVSNRFAGEAEIGIDEIYLSEADRP